MWFNYQTEHAGEVISKDMFLTGERLAKALADWRAHGARSAWSPLMSVYGAASAFEAGA